MEELPRTGEGVVACGRGQWSCCAGQFASVSRGGEKKDAGGKLEPTRGHPRGAEALRLLQFLQTTRQTSIDEVYGG